MEVEMNTSDASLTLPLKAVTSPGIPARPSSSSSASCLAEYSCEVPEVCRQTCLLIESSRTSSECPRRKRRGKKRRRADSSTEINQSVADIDSIEISAKKSDIAQNTSERQFSEPERTTDISANMETTDADTSDIYNPSTIACGATYTDSAVSSVRSRLSRRQRRRRSVQQQQLAPPPILRPIHVPHAPLNSTSFLMEEHQLPSGSCSQQYTPFDGDDDFMDRDFDTVYQAAHMQELNGLQPEQLSHQLQQLEERHRQLEAELLRRDPDVWVERLQRRLMQLQKHNQLLIKTQTALRETAERLSVDSPVEEDPSTQTHIQDDSSSPSRTDTHKHAIHTDSLTHKHTNLSNVELES